MKKNIEQYRKLTTKFMILIPHYLLLFIQTHLNPIRY